MMVERVQKPDRFSYQRVKTGEVHQPHPFRVRIAQTSLGDVRGEYRIETRFGTHGSILP